MTRTIRTILATFSMYVVTHLFVFMFLPLALLASLVSKRSIPNMKQWLLTCLFGIVGKRLKVSGLEHLNPRESYVIISNYPSFYAAFSLIGTFPQAYIVAHAFTSRVPLLGWALRRIGALFVQPGRSGKGMKAIDVGLSKADEIPGVIILPEGARTPDGEIHRFRRGFVRILRQTDLDLLPVTLNGMYRLKPVKRFHLDPEAEVEMIIHPPVPSASMRRMSDADLIEMAQETIASVYQR